MKSMVIISVFLFSSNLFAFNYSIVTDTLKIQLEGTITDVETDLPIEHVTVKLLGSDSSNITATTDSAGYYIIFLSPGVNYSIFVSNENYLNAKGNTPYNISYSSTYSHDFKLQKIKKCVMPFPKIMFTKGSSTLTKISEQNNPIDSIGFIYYTMTNNPSLIFSATGYRDSTENKSISKKRTKSVISYLVNQGIDKKRLQLIDGGVLKNNREVHFSIINNNYPLE